jgi:predicted Zn-dependent protease
LPPPVVITLVTSETLQADDEVAFVLSHEMGHAIDPEPNSNEDNEKRADALGIVFVMRAGYDARSAGRGLQMVKGERGQGVLGNLMGLLDHVADGSDIHGYTGDRIVLMKQEYAKQCGQLKNRPIGCKQGWK